MCGGLYRVEAVEAEARHGGQAVACAPERDLNGRLSEVRRLTPRTCTQLEGTRTVDCYK
jgi:hypothetical protein